MDFDFSAEETKKDTRSGFGFNDHSPNTGGGISPPGYGTSGSDDFEHISSDKLLDTDYDLLGSSMINAPSTNLSGGRDAADKQNLLDGFSFTESKQDSDFGFDSSPKFGSPAHQKASTIDFMKAERSEPPPLPSQPPNLQKKSSLLDDIEDDYMNPYATKKTADPLLTSSWQRDADADADDDFGGKRTPSPDPFVQTRNAVEQLQQREQEPVVKPAPVVAPVRPVEVAPVAPVKPILEPEVIKPVVKPVEEPKKIEKPVEVVKPAAAVFKKPDTPKASSSSSAGLTTVEELFCNIGLGEYIFYIIDHFYQMDICLVSKSNNSLV